MSVAARRVFLGLTPDRAGLDGRPCTDAVHSWSKQSWCQARLLAGWPIRHAILGRAVVAFGRNPQRTGANRSWRWQCIVSLM